MKKTLILVLIILYNTVAFSQSQIKFDPLIGEILTSTNIIDNTLCSQSNVVKEYHNFASITGVDQWIANDLFVQANEIFALEHVVVDLNSENGIDSIDVIIWSDDGGLPDTIINEELFNVPTSQTYIYTTINGFEVYETVIDLTNSFLLEGGTSGSTFWVQLMAHSTGAGVGWHYTNINVEGYRLASNQAGYGWFLSPIPIDGTYIFAGECSIVLDVEDKLSDHISIYPNPTQDVINFQTLKTTSIIEADLYSLTGKKINVSIDNDKMDISSLSEGLYLLQLTTSKGTFTQKILKY
jgi:hypothetical protein